MSALHGHCTTPYYNFPVTKSQAQHIQSNSFEVNLIQIKRAIKSGGYIYFEKNVSSFQGKAEHIDDMKMNEDPKSRKTSFPTQSKVSLRAQKSKESLR